MLALIDIHTLFVLVFSSTLPVVYVLSGATFAILKGVIFYIPDSDILSFIDIIMGCLMLFLLIGPLFSYVYWTIFLYLTYKIVISLSAI